MNSLDPVITIAILLSAALVGGMIAHRLRQPVILGYLLVGVAVGPYALGLVKDEALVQGAATMGVALLMLTLGLEVSVAQLKQVGRVGLWGGISQIAVTIIIGFIAGVSLFKWSLAQSFIFGLIISLSSTMVCLKILTERGELDSIHGRIMIAILILQDISVALMMVIEPLLGEPVTSLLFATATGLGKAAIFVGIAIALGLWGLPWLLGRVGGVRSRELFLLTVLVLSLGAALSTHIFGISAVFGAFVIGLVLRETTFAHQALAVITPLRDVFATLFFVSLGMLLSPKFVLDNWPLISLTVFGVVVVKLLVVFGIVRFFGYSKRIAFLAGAGLFQIGEFGFILAQGGINMGIVTEQFYALVLSSAIITMLLTPLLINIVSIISHRLAKVATKGVMVAEDFLPSIDSRSYLDMNPVVIAGYGRVGQNIGRGLQQSKIPYIVIESDPEIVSELRYRKINCIYGDASNIHVLSQIDLNKIIALVVTFPDPLAVAATVKSALEFNPKLRILARVHRKKEVELLQPFETVELISPEYQASIEFLKRIFACSPVGNVDVDQVLARLGQKEDMANSVVDNEG